jgi:hypothetical protein
MKTIPVAAVYDRRNETIPAVIDSRYRAAVYDRRTESIPALMERRYSRNRC